MGSGRLYRVSGSSIHNRGVLATQPIAAETYILQYLGEKITKAESERRGIAQMARGKRNHSGQVYIFELNKRYDLDGFRQNNPARYINHSCDPNCEAVNWKGQIWVVAKRDIEEGEELTYDYGFALEHFLDHPCRCGASNCCGYIVAEAERPKLLAILKKRNRKVATNGAGDASELAMTLKS